MGEAVTEAGAISAVAAFFRQRLNACAWTEEIHATTLFHSTANNERSKDPTAPPLLRFNLRTFDSSCSSDRNDEAPACGGLDLVVSRGPGPDFSEHETRVSAQAAALLSQALSSIRSRTAFAETKTALENSFRGMEEVSAAVSILVREREEREALHSQLYADLEGEHERAMSVAGEQFRRSRAEVADLRRRLGESEESTAAVAGIAKALFRIAAADASGAAGTNHGGVGAAATFDGALAEMVGLVENSARKGLRCAVARVERLSEPAAAPAAAGRAREVETDEHERAPAAECGDSDASADRLRVRVPSCDATEPPTMLLHAEARTRAFSAGEKAAVTALAACLGTGILALRETQRRRELAEKAEADRHSRASRDRAKAAAAAAAAAEAKRRGERTVTGMRSLVANAEGCKRRADAEAAAACRAELQTDALRHLLAGLDGAGCGHAAIAAAVAERAVAVVPACTGVVLLTPRGPGSKGSGNTCATGGRRDASVFSPDPRAWATAASQAAGGGEASRRDKHAESWGWAASIERAASDAATRGSTICVGDYGSAPDGAGARRVFCFSPVPTLHSSRCDRRADVVGGNNEGERRSVSDGLSGEGGGAELRRTAPVSFDGDGDDPACVIAWAVSLSGLAADDGDAFGGSFHADSSPLDSPATVVDDGTTSPRLPKGVFAAMESAVHAVRLALSAADSAEDAAAAARDRRAGDTHPPAGMGGHSWSGSKYTQRESRENRPSGESHKKSREAELKRLRQGTSALAARVRTLEKKAAGLRASEARSTVDLARARADVMAAKGELQLAALERDRLASRLGDREAGRGQVQPTWERVRERPPRAARWGCNRCDAVSPHCQAGRAAVATEADEEDLSPTNKDPCRLDRRSKQLGGVWGEEKIEDAMHTPRKVGGGTAPVNSSAAAAVFDGGTGVVSAIDLGKTTQETALQATAGVPESAAGASSEALQRMASVHARLSDSLRRGILGGAS